MQLLQFAQTMIFPEYYKRTGIFLGLSERMTSAEAWGKKNIKKRKKKVHS